MDTPLPIICPPILPAKREPVPQAYPQWYATERGRWPRQPVAELALEPKT